MVSNADSVVDEINRHDDTITTNALTYTLRPRILKNRQCQTTIKNKSKEKMGVSENALYSAHD